MKKLFVLFALSFTLQNSYGAAIIGLSNPVSFVSAMVFFASGPVTVAATVTQREKLRRAAVWSMLSSYAIFVLEESEQSIQMSLSRKFPTIPKYIIDEAAYMILYKSKQIEGEYKKVIFSSREYQDLKLAMPQEINDSEFEKILISDIPII